MARLALASAALLGVVAGCDAEASDVGKPCEQKSDCAGYLICDIHEGRGSCQSEHQHDESALPMSIKWIEVAASDYKLDLVPAYDPDITSYTAQADGPGIVVYANIILSDDADDVTVNGVAAELVGYRTWRSTEATDLVAPTMMTIEVSNAAGSLPAYDIEITVP